MESDRINPLFLYDKTRPDQIKSWFGSVQPGPEWIEADRIMQIIIVEY